MKKKKKEKKSKHQKTEKKESHGFSGLRKKLKWLDPFTYVDEFLMPKANPNNNEIISWIVYLISAAVFALAIYWIASVILSTPYPGLIVLSASMEPMMHRGDIVLLQGASFQQINAPEVAMQGFELGEKFLPDIAEPDYESQRIIFASGDAVSFENVSGNSIIVYHSDITLQPVIHRVLAKVNAKDGWFYFVKGDNNPYLDQDCGTVELLQVPGTDQFTYKWSQPCITLHPIDSETIAGKYLFHIPVLGCAKLWIIDNPLSIITTGRLPQDFKDYC